MGLSEKILAILAVLCVTVLACGCLGGEQSSSEATDTASEGADGNVTIGDCELFLDFEDKNIEVKPHERSVEQNYRMDYTFLRDKSTNAPGYVYIHDFSYEFPTSKIQSGLESSMNRLCENVSTEKYKDGFIGKGIYKDGGQETWGVSLPINNVDGQASRLLTVIAAFEDEDFNEKLVKSISVEDLQCHVQYSSSGVTSSMSDDVAMSAIRISLRDAGISDITTQVADGRENGGTKSLIMSYRSLSTTSGGVSEEIGSILGAFLGTVKGGWDCDELSAVVGDSRGNAIGLWYCSKSWKDGYIEGTMTDEEIILKVLSTVQTL